MTDASENDMLVTDTLPISFKHLNVSSGRRVGVEHEDWVGMLAFKKYSSKVKGHERVTKECFLWFSMEVPKTGMKLLLISVFCFLMFLYIYYILQNIHFLTKIFCYLLSRKNYWKWATHWSYGFLCAQACWSVPRPRMEGGSCTLCEEWRLHRRSSDPGLWARLESCLCLCLLAVQLWGF